MEMIYNNIAIYAGSDLEEGEIDFDHPNYNFIVWDLKFNPWDYFYMVVINDGWFEFESNNQVANQIARFSVTNVDISAIILNIDFQTKNFI